MTKPELSAAQIRQQLKHPVIDCDGHWMESLPVFLEYLRDVAGPQLTDDFVALKRSDANRRAVGAVPDGMFKDLDAGERASRRLPKGAELTISNTLDKATSMLPSLLYQRLDELGIDFGIVYPSLGQEFNYVAREDLRRALVRAHNVMTADVFNPYRDRLAPVAIVAVHTPNEAVEEADFAVSQLGFKAIMIHGNVPRPIPACGQDSFGTAFRDASYRVPYYIDTLALDSPCNYEPFWQKCADLRVAITSHAGAHAWPDRRSTSNYVFNHAGHFAQANHTFAKSVFLGGVTRRHPSLNFAFLEGGVGYAVNLLWDLVSHWERFNPRAAKAHYNPEDTDFAQLAGLIAAHAYPRLKDKLDEAIDGLRKGSIEFGDDFERAGIRCEQDVIDLFSGSFYFGCEADDPIVPWAFDQRTGVRLKPVFSSDISHNDVPVMANVLPEAFELVERGWLTESDFREFVFDNARHLHSDANPDFFKDTVIEKQAILEH
jgi:predicted TIM-barrel fold metal-dependent hydrolase